MRWFWSFILLLCLITGGLYAQRVRAEQQEQAAASEPGDPAPRTRQPRQPRTTEQPQPAATASEQPEPIVVQPEPAPEPVAQDSVAVEQQPEPSTANETPKNAFDPGSLITTMNELRDQLPQELHARNQKPSTELKPVRPEARSTDEPEAKPEIVAKSLPQTNDANVDVAADAKPEILPEAQPAPAAPSYEQRPDGSFRIVSANIWVQGAGTQAEPYVLTWDALKAIEQSYDPKNGKDTLPGWLDLLEGKVVQIEGHSLLPVVASSTRELLMMQNPWDGCCIGVPPTPYDAVEVTLNHEVDFGNSVVGFGSVQGTFYIDPYVVDGWVLGLYIIEDGTYRSGAGVEFPEF
ncbi:MAG: hypothetical protein KDA29_06565 [Phycisphaerales bacterium]|nr:hypothetical protein [Phycisphaerales bacterium]